MSFIHAQQGVTESDKLLSAGSTSSGIWSNRPNLNRAASISRSLNRTRQSFKRLFGLNIAPPPTGTDSNVGNGAGARPRVCPEDSASWLSQIFYTYANGLIKVGLKKHLEHDDLWDMGRRDDAAVVSGTFFGHLADTADPTKAPQGVVWKAIWRTHGVRFAWAGVLKMMHDCVMFLSPFLLGRLLNHMSAGGSREGALGLSFAILGVAVVENVSVNIYFHILYRMSLHLKIDMIQMLYEKSLRISSAVKAEMGIGSIVNLQSNDASKIWSMPLFLHIVWNGPFQIFVVMGMLVRIMSWAPAMAGLAVTILLIPLSTLVGRALARARKEMVKYIDARVKLSSEIITGIRAIKLYAWEIPYVERVTGLREKELVQIFRTQLMSSLNTAVFMSGPVLVSLAAFGVYAALGKPLTAAVAFPALALFNLLRFPIIMFPSQVMSLINANVGLQRIQKFLEAQEMDQAALTPAAHPPSPGNSPRKTAQPAVGGKLAPGIAVAVTNGTFAWGQKGEESPSVTDASLQIQAGQLVIVVGQVGAGKSSLLAALLGEMHTVSGSVAVAGTLAYTAQDPWIQNSTLRKNVLMGTDFDTQPYAAVLTACALGPDLEMLPAGDASEIGEKGINLSGGQKHRVALARAAYAAADIYLLDDPLSAVDAHVGRTLFDDCICGLLGDKTRILVTHQLQYLALADLIVVMAGGKITEVGSYDELVAKGVQFSEFVAADKAAPPPPAQSTDMDAAGNATVSTARHTSGGLDPVAVASAIRKSIGEGKLARRSPGGSGDDGANGAAGSNGELSASTSAYASASSQAAVAMNGNSKGQASAFAPAANGRSGTSGQASSDSDAEEGLGDSDRAVLLPPAAAVSKVHALALEMATQHAHGHSAVSDDSANAQGDGHVSRKEGREVDAEEEGESVPLVKGRLLFISGDHSNAGSPANGTRGTATPRHKSGVASSAASASRMEGERAKLMASLSLKEKDGKLVKVEERAKGSVKRSVYNAYLSAWSSYYILPIAMVFTSLAERGLQIGQNFELSAWANSTTAAEKEGKPLRTRYYMILYLILGLVSMALQIMRSVLLVSGSIRASRKLQQELLSKVVRLPMSFFDSQPTGRLLNRFTKDIEAVDIQVSSSVNSAITTFVSAAMSVVVVIIVSPLVCIALVPLALLYHQVQRLYINSTRELKRLDSVAFSPIFQHFNESLQGLMTIRAFRKQALFVGKCRDNLNHSNRAYWPIQVVNRWLSVRLELMGASIVFLAAVTVSVVLPKNAGLAGLAITSALNLTGIMNWMVRQTTELEVNMNSVERLIEYNTQPEEAPAVLESRRPPGVWPTRGAIVVHNLQVRYRPDLDLVLRHLTFEVRSGEKVGVCGRTGCGKSTLMMTLYRIVEPCGGSITIDDINIASIGLRDLRSRLSLVPQDPIIFSGTIRSNLDPFQQVAHDKDIWEALERAGVDGFVRDLEAGLDSPLKEGGSNLSTGQRQLLCMARALLRKSKILVLDEATSNVDNTTDALIQRTIRTAFKECTVLTIAHRLHTIIDSDRILVLDSGELAEYDTPSALLATPSSMFRALVEETTKDGGVAADLVAAALGGVNGSAADMANAGVAGYGHNHQGSNGVTATSHAPSRLGATASVAASSNGHVVIGPRVLGTSA